jgi:hypothetical protein
MVQLMGGRIGGQHGPPSRHLIHKRHVRPAIQGTRRPSAGAAANVNMPRTAGQSDPTMLNKQGVHWSDGIEAGRNGIRV